jgi:hypothetical protein
MFEYSGVIHIHSIFSDGTGTIEDIAKAANEVGLDFFIMTDHNNTRPLKSGYARWFKNTMSIIGYELNDIKNENHYLVFGLTELVGSFIELKNGEFGNELDAKEYVDLINKKGGIGFIAHPFEKRKGIPGHPAYPWTEWEISNFDGIEIWNHMSEWTEGLTDSNKFQRFLHPLKTIVSPNKDAVDMWDNLNLRRKVTAIGSVDAHAHRHKFLGYEVFIFPYKILFKSIRTHVFVENEIIFGDDKTYEESKKQILQAIKNGNTYIANSYHGDAKGFRFYADYCGKFYNMGDEFDIEINKCKTFKLIVYLPKAANIKLKRNGKLIDELDGMEFSRVESEPGNYRIECWIGDKAWIFSNNIRIK